MLEPMNKQDAIETLEIFRNDYTREGSAICRAIDIAIDALKQQTIETKVRHGHWIKQENGLNICSVCGVTKVSHLPFCGHCGAKMDDNDTNDSKVGSS